MPVCSVCNDTHHVESIETGRGFMCTSCPVPCQKCRCGGNGPYCEHTPCDCECHGQKNNPSIDLISDSLYNLLISEDNNTQLLVDEIERYKAKYYNTWESLMKTPAFRKIIEAIINANRFHND